jgi:hypothetical protein
MTAVCDYGDYVKVATRFGRIEQMGLKDGKNYQSAYKFCDYKLPKEYELFKKNDKRKNGGGSRKSKSSMQSSKMSIRGRLFKKT